MNRRNFLAASLGAATLAHADTPDLTSMTLEGIPIIRASSVSSLDLTRACLARTKKLQPLLNAYITVTGDQALAEVRMLDGELQRGKWRGPLHGIPIALKDNIDTAGIRTTGASQLFKDRIPTKTPKWRDGSRTPARSCWASSTCMSSPTAGHRRLRISGQSTILGIPRSLPADRQVAPARQWLPTCVSHP